MRSKYFDSAQFPSFDRQVKDHVRGRRTESAHAGAGLRERQAEMGVRRGQERERIAALK